MSSLTVCLDCQQNTSGRCWRHRNADFVNQRPAPPTLPAANVRLVDVIALIEDAAKSTDESQ